jgi:acyl dehydratase
MTTSSDTPTAQDTTDPTAFRTLLDSFIGRPMGAGGPSVAPDPVNVPMIRHWVDAMDDRNPIYLDDDAAAAASFGSVVAPPAMLQTWTMPRPVIQGIAERGGAPQVMSHKSVIGVLDDAGYTSTRATNSELEFERYLHPGDVLSSSTVCESISDEKTTALGTGFFVTWCTTYVDATGEVVGRQRFRVLKFKAAAREASA